MRVSVVSLANRPSFQLLLAAHAVMSHRRAEEYSRFCPTIQAKENQHHLSSLRSLILTKVYRTSFGHLISFLPLFFPLKNPHPGPRAKTIRPQTVGTIKSRSVSSFLCSFFSPRSQFP